MTLRRCRLAGQRAEQLLGFALQAPSRGRGAVRRPLGLHRASGSTTTAAPLPSSARPLRVCATAASSSFDGVRVDAASLPTANCLNSASVSRNLARPTRRPPGRPAHGRTPTRRSRSSGCDPSRREPSSDSNRRADTHRSAVRRARSNCKRRSPSNRVESQAAAGRIETVVPLIRRRRRRPGRPRRLRRRVSPSRRVRTARPAARLSQDRANGRRSRARARQPEFGRPVVATSTPPNSGSQRRGSIAPIVSQRSIDDGVRLARAAASGR